MRKKRAKFKHKKKLSIVVALITVLFQLFTIFPAVQVKSADVTTGFPFITEITLTDGNGKLINESSNPIKKNAEVNLNYKFELPNDHKVKKGDTYTMQIPKEIKIISKLDFPIKLDNDDTIANVTIGTDGKVNIIFNEFVEKNSNVSGFFYIETQFDPDKIGGPSPVPIKFEIGGTSGPYVINVNFEQPPVPKASVKKEGSYDASKNEITWKVTINPENVKVSKAQIVDNISEGQEFIPGSVMINGANADTINYSYDGSSNKLTYNFPDVIEKQQVMIFKTKVINPKAFESEGVTVYEYNKAIFNHDGTSKESNNASVSIFTDFIRKDGSYDAATKRINWTIYVNNNAQNIPNAVVEDDIPSGLTFIPDSVKIDGKETKGNYTVDGQKFTYTFPNAINEPHKIEFSTEVTDEDAFNSNTGKSYNNTAKLIGKGVPGNASATKGVGVPTSIIRKQGAGYNPATGEITWKITVNSNKIAIKNAVITDDIRLGQEYVDGSATIDKDIPSGSFKYVKADEGDTKKTGTLTYTVSGDIKETYVITFKTRVTDPKVYAGNSYETYYNTAELKGDNIKPSSSQGSQIVQSYVVYKQSQDYNYITREVTWNVRINLNNMKLPNAYFTDTIKEGQEFVANSVEINGKPADASNYSYTEATRTLRYNFPKEINNEQVITFRTKITDDSIFKSNGEKQISNTGKLITDLVPGGVESTGTGKIKNTLIGKTADYVIGNNYIDWNVTINSNKILIKDAVLTDTLQEGLDLDTTSVKLYKQILNTNGTLEKGEEVTLDGNNIKYNGVTREFTFTLPAITEEAYILSFRTEVIDKKKSPFVNSIAFKGTGLIEGSDSGKVDVIFQGAGGGGVGTTGSIKVVKVDKNNKEIKLQGAEFELLDMYKNVIRTSEPTGENGEALFDRLKFDIDYYVREKSAPTGYLLSDEVYKFQLKNTTDGKNITYIYKDQVITGSIEFYKNGENNDALKGAEFALYKLSDTGYKNPIATAISDESGKVEFKNVAYGEYAIREIKAPEGYNLSEEILKAAITEEGRVVKANPYIIPNTKIRGNIEFIKLGETKNPLSGAEFKLYKEEDKNFENPLATAVSDGSGHVKFNSIEYGKYIIKETRAPEGYVLIEEPLVAVITQNGVTVKANPESISNTIIRGNIEFTKLGEVEDPLPGAEFVLYHEEDKNFENPVSKAMSDEKGKVEFKAVEYGKYLIKETKAPEGYLLSDEVLEVNIVENGISIKPNKENISNTKIRGNIEFTKLGENEVPLPGAGFTLYSEEDKNFENPIFTAFSGIDGKVQFKNVEYGKYVIKETIAPEGYNLSEEVLTANITKDGSQVTANPESISNTKIRGNIEFTKLGENKDPLKGPEFKLYKEEDKTFENPIATVVSDENGHVFFENVEYGKYVIKETKAPEGYLLSEEVLTANITKNGVTVKADPESISNKKIRGNIEFNKLGEDKDSLPGAEFALYHEDDEKFENPVSKAISDEKGKVEFKDVEYGKYAIKEIKAPEGYLLSEEVLTAVITENGVVVTANPDSISNTKIRGNIEFTKLGENNDPLLGAEFTLYSEKDKNFENPLFTAISDEEGKVEFKDLEYGKYVIKETKAPEGYVLSEEILEASVTEDGVTVKANPESISNIKIRGSVQIKKLDENNNPLQGAEFTLYDAEGKVIETSLSGKDGLVLFENLVYGKYIIKETKSPKGYIAAEGEIKVFVDKHGEIYTYEVVNNKIKEVINDLPKTGTSNSMAISIIGALIILSGIGLFLKRKKAK